MGNKGIYKKEANMSSKKLPEKKIFSLGERILIVKDDHGLNNSNFAESLGWTSSQVTKYTKNQDTPGFEKLLDLNRVYNVILHWLITGIGDKYFTSPELFTIKYARPLINDSSQEYTFHAPAADPLTDEQLEKAYRIMQNIHLKLQAAKHPFRRHIIHLLDAILDLFE
jgi:transcriptional regulator with XRE-family HTH domain